MINFPPNSRAQAEPKQRTPGTMLSLLTRPLSISRVSMLATGSTRNFSIASTTSALSLLRRQPLAATTNPTTTTSSALTAGPSIETPCIFSNLLSLGGQRRWKSRGNSYQPNTYKRKRTLGFMSRMRSKTGRKIIARRREKGRWYLSH